jgi:surfeit locus 1 family protein
MRFVFPLVIGVFGCVVLTWLGLWQLQRLEWKEGELARIEAMIPAAPVDVPVAPDPVADKYRSVAVSGAFDGSDAPVFLSSDVGPIYRLVAAFETEDGRRIMVDRGFISGLSEPDPALRTAPAEGVTLTGNLHWPDEVDRWTPERDARGVFFGRDVAELAEALGTEPVLVVAREVSVNDPPATPLPVTTAGIPNNHLGYAVQWFGLALVWAGMTLFLLWRTAKRTD